MDINKKVKEYEKNIVNDICEIVKIKSIEEAPKEDMPFGKGPYLALNKALEQAKRLGFEKVVNMDNYCGYVEVGEGEEVIGVLTHVDIVPEGEDWDYEPYGAEIVDGKIYARGVADNKGPGVMALYALKILVDMGVTFNKRVRLIYGANEESGFGCMKHYVEKEGDLTYGFSPDADFPLIFGEKGIVQLQLKGKAKCLDKVKIQKISGGEAANVVAPKVDCILRGEDLEWAKDTFDAYLKETGLTGDSFFKDNMLHLQLRGVSAHASKPHTGKNAISYLFNYLNLVCPNNTLVKPYNENIALSYLGENCNAACEDGYGPLTFNVGVIDYDNGDFNITIDIRYPITKTFEPIFANIKEAFASTDFTIDLALDKKPLYVNPNSDLVKTLYGVYVDVTKDTTNKPFTIGGGTYSRAFSNVVAFGANIPGVDEETAHMKNEYLNISSALTCTEIFAKAILALLKI